jgi:cobalamin biosynthesis protein CobT
LLHERIKQDGFEIFEKDSIGNLSDEGKRLLNLSKVKYYRTIQSINQFLHEAIVEFSTLNLQNKQNNSIDNNVSENITERSMKRKSLRNVTPKFIEPIFIKYLYEEIIVNEERDSNLSALESPYKRITLSIAMDATASGVDSQGKSSSSVILNFEMLTAKHSPSASRILIQNDNDDDDDDDSNGSKNSDDNKSNNAKNEKLSSKKSLLETTNRIKNKKETSKINNQKNDVENEVDIEEEAIDEDEADASSDFYFIDFNYESLAQVVFYTIFFIIFYFYFLSVFSFIIML